VLLSRREDIRKFGTGKSFDILEVMRRGWKRGGAIKVDGANGGSFCEEQRVSDDIVAEGGERGGQDMLAF
jgi:hypothetical protein